MNWPSPSGMSRNMLGANSSSGDGMRGHKSCSFPKRPRDVLRQHSVLFDFNAGGSDQRTVFLVFALNLGGELLER